MKSLGRSIRTSRPVCPWSLAFAATLVCLPLLGIARAQTVSIQTADVQSYFAADSETLATSQQSDPPGLNPWPLSGFGPYTITGPAGVPPLPAVPPVPAAIGPANSFAVAPWTSQFADLPTNTLSKSVIWANAPAGTNVADGHVGVNMRLENPTTTYAFHQMNFSVDYVANAPLGGGIAGLPTFFVSGTTTGVNSYAEFGASIDYYWTDINTAGIVGATTPLGSVSYYWSLIGPGSAFLTPVLPSGALAATPIGSTGGLLSVVGKAFVAGDPAVIEVSPVPEPATCFMALAGMACGGLSLWRRRRASRHGAAMIPARGGRAMTQAVLCLAMCIGAASAQALPLVETLNTNMTRFLVNATTNVEIPIPNSPFQSDSLARSAAGPLYSADASGVIWDVTGSFQIPVGPTSRTQIGDLVMGVNGLWGFSNASQELFFFDLGSLGVTYGQVITGLGGSTVTGVAYEPSTGDVYLSGYTGFNADTLYRVTNSSTAATTVGAMANGDAGSYFSDIEFDASGTLYAMSWYNRWFYTVSTVNGATTFLSAGPHRDVTAMALTVPEPGTLGLAAAGLAAAGMPGARRRWFGRRGSPTAA